MNFLNLNNNLIQYLFILIPLFLITGPFLPDLTIYRIIIHFHKL